MTDAERLLLEAAVRGSDTETLAAAVVAERMTPAAWLARENVLRLDSHMNGIRHLEQLIAGIERS